MADAKLSALSDDEASVLLAFMDTMEAQRTACKLSSWRVTRGPMHWFAEVLTLEGNSFIGGGPTFDDARKNLADEMVRAALDGWPGAGQG